MPIEVRKARLIEAYDIAPDVKHFTFEVPAVADLPYSPGQFVSFTQEIGGKKITRAYSTASAPTSNRFDLCLNRVADGLFSPFLFDLKPGDEIDMKGPLGAFTWRHPVKDSVLVATGTGIAPFRSMLHSYLPNAGDASVALVYGVRYEPSLLYRAEFEALERSQPNFRFLPVLSRPSEDWKGRTGHVQQHVMDLLGDRKDMDVYICGMKLMVDDLRAQLKEKGLDRRHIIFEKYD
jgi:NAD(P)H-flavin reductase